MSPTLTYEEQFNGSIQELSLPDLDNLTNSQPIRSAHISKYQNLNISEITEKIPSSVIEKILPIIIKLALCHDKTSRISCLTDNSKMFNIESLHQEINQQNGSTE